MSALAEIAELLRADGGLLAAAVRDPAPDAPTPYGVRAGSWPLVVEAVYEGHLLHHGRARIVSQADPDLALLAGDRLFALGLERLAAAGDLAAVTALADTIALAAMAVAAADPDLEDAVWTAGAVEVGAGTSAAHGEAKAAARRGDPAAAGLLRAAARQDT